MGVLERIDKDVTDDQILEKTRKLVQKAKKSKNANNKQNKVISLASTLPVFPELPEIDDLDWFDDFDMTDIENFSDDDEFLSTLPDSFNPNDQIVTQKVETPRRSKQQKSPRSSMIVESESIPLEANEYDYLAGFNQHINLNDTIHNTDDDNNNDNNNNNNNDNNNNNGGGGGGGDISNAGADNGVAVTVRPPGQNEGYHFENPRTAAMMEAMQKRRANFANKNVKESPMDKFQRLYGRKKNTPPPLQGQNHQQPFLAVVRRSEFKKNDARVKRLMNLKKVWLEGP